MPLFAITCIDKPAHAHVRAEARPAHLEYAKAHESAMIIGGPMLSPDGEGMVGSLLVLDVADLDAAYEWCRNDPYAKAGLFESVIVRPYKAVLGSAKPAA